MNTTDDELHPAPTPDGRYLVFMRTRLLPKLNGDIVPPEERSLFVADRQAGTVTALNRTGSGPVFESGSGLVWGVRPFANFQQRLVVSRFASFANGALTGSGEELGSPPSGGLVEVTHADRGLIREFDFFISAERNSPARYLSYAVVDSTTGALRNQIVQFTTARANQSGIGTDGQTKNLGSETAPAGHPDARSDDYVAFHQGAGSAADIQTITFPGTDLAPAPAPITTAAPERDPTWSPNGLNLGFVRTSDGRRRLGVYNATPGIQTILNPLADLGAEAPTPQTRAYHEVWGGLSISDGAPSTAPLIICDSACLNQVASATSPQTIPLAPRVSAPTKIGIFVVRVTGKRKLLGRSAPRIRVVGKVPLGRARKGRNRFRWNGKVNGKRLKRGTYLLTYRSLKGESITNTSDSLRFKIAKGGGVRQVRRERVRTPKR